MPPARRGRRPTRRGRRRSTSARTGRRRPGRSRRRAPARPRLTSSRPHQTSESESSAHVGVDVERAVRWRDAGRARCSGSLPSNSARFARSARRWRRARHSRRTRPPRRAATAPAGRSRSCRPAGRPGRAARRARAASRSASPSSRSTSRRLLTTTRRRLKCARRRGGHAEGDAVIDLVADQPRAVRVAPGRRGRPARPRWTIVPVGLAGLPTISPPAAAGSASSCATVGWKRVRGRQAARSPGSPSARSMLR